MTHRWMPGTVMLLVACLAFVGCRERNNERSDESSGTKEGAKAPVEQAPVTTPATEPPGKGEEPGAVPGTKAAIDKGIAWLRSAQLADGGWPMEAGGSTSNLGVTCVAAHGLLAIGVPATDPTVQKAIGYILEFVKDDGGIYDEGLKNYTTSIGLMVLKATGDTRYETVEKKALAFLMDLQWDKGEGIEQDSPDWGGGGYGQYRRPDLSNTQWLVQAYKESGLSPDDPAMRNALIFISRTQAGEAAKGYWTSDGKGGFIYSPHAGGESKAGEFALPSGEKGLKAYGSMTYAGFLSLIYAGLDREDQRVQAALEWIKNHWTLEENPEMGKQGYYYYLMSMGKALRAYGEPTLVDDRGNNHDWRKELSAKLVSMQTDDGSWVNADESRWFEGNPAIATPFALIGLKACTTDL